MFDLHKNKKKLLEQKVEAEAIDEVAPKEGDVFDLRNINIFNNGIKSSESLLHHINKLGMHGMYYDSMKKAQEKAFNFSKRNLGGQSLKEAQSYISEYLSKQTKRPEPVKMAEPSYEYKEIVRNKDKRWKDLEIALKSQKKKKS